MNSETQIVKGIWNELDDETRRAELSHWRGVGKFMDDRVWTSIGKRTKKNLEFFLRVKKRKWDSVKVILEWGSGGGANAFHLCQFPSYYFGVDVSSKNLNEASRVCTQAGFDNFRQILIDREPEDILESLESTKIDAFISTAVFQHFPSKDYGVRVLKTLNAACAANAIGLIQIRYDDGSERYSGNKSLDQYKSNYIIATTYKIDEFYEICESSGFNVVCMNGVNRKVNYITFMLEKNNE
jgi:hypothetical protein